MSVVKIYNPSELPFGKLSNHSLHYMMVHNNTYNTVTNYILSNMLNTPLYRQVLQSAPITQAVKKSDLEAKVKAIIARTEQKQQRVISPEERVTIRNQAIIDLQFNKMNIYQLYEYYLGLEQQDIIQKAVADGYIARLSGPKRDEIIQSLLETGEAPIEYDSKNQILGIGENKKGANLLGKWFMQLRQNIRSSQREQEKIKQRETLTNQLFIIYQAYVILNYELDRQNDLTNYVGLSANDIVSTYKGTVLKKIPETLKTTIVQMYHRGQFPFFSAELQSPGYLVHYLRKERLRTMTDQLREKQLNTMVQYYVEHVLKQENMKKGIEMTQAQIEEASSQFMSLSPDAEAYFKLRNRVIELYKQNKLPPSVQQRIEQHLSSVIIPTDQDIQKAEEMESVMLRRRSSSSESREEKEEQKTDLLSNLFKQEDRTRKNFLLQQLRNLGIDKAKYQSYDLEKLDYILQKYAKKVNGHWQYRIQPSGKLLYRNIVPLTLREVENIVQDYNEKVGENVSLTNVSSQWALSPMEEEKMESFQVPVGEVVKIPMDASHILSPLYNDPFIIQNWTYPHVSMYITTALMLNTGITTTKKDGSVIYRRTIPISKVHSMLWRNNQPVSPEEASALYTQYKDSTYRELLTKLNRQALQEKFKDTSLQELLLLTGKSHLLWTDKEDTHLGLPTNVVGMELEALRDKLRTEKPKYKTISEGMVSQFLLNDDFMKTWLEMRVKDMCQVVVRLQKYLNKAGPVKQDIDSRFTRIVLDTVYQPCSVLISLAKKQKIRMPEYFVKWVEENDIVTMQYSKDYKKEKEKLELKINEVSEDYYPTSQKVVYKGVENLNQFLDRQLKELTQYKSTDPSPEELANYINLQKQEFLDFSQGEVQLYDPFAELAKRQKKEWAKFLDKVLKPKLSLSEIKEQLKENEREYKKQLETLVSSADRATAITNYNEKRQVLITQLFQPKILVEQGVEAYQAEFQKMRTKFNKDWEQVQKIRESKLTKDQIAEYNKEIQDLMLQLARLNKERKTEQLYYQYKIQEIAQVLWDRLAVMIQVVVQNLKEPTSHNIKLVLARAELLNSTTAKCQPVVPENEDKCIVSAIQNILVGIERFKQEYNETIKLDKPDVDLAVSILLNRNVHIEEEEEEKEEEKQKEEEKKLEISFMAGEDLALERELSADEENLWEEEEEKWEEELQDQEASFALSDKGLEQIKIFLRTLDSSRKTADIDDVATYFSAMIEKVKTYQLSPSIKTNRINFFASLL